MIEKTTFNDISKEAVSAFLEASKQREAQNDLKLALEYALEAWQTFHALPERDALQEGSLLQQLAQVHLRRQEYSKYEEYSRSLLMLAKREDNPQWATSALLNLAIVRSIESDYKAAMGLFLEALEKSQAHGLRTNVVKSLINIGNIYAHLFNHEDALDRYSTVLSEYANELGPHTSIVLNMNIGNLYYASEQYATASNYLTEALDLAELHGQKHMAAHALALLSRSHLALKEVPQAFEKALKARDLMSEIGAYNATGRQINLLNLAHIAHFHHSAEEAAQLAVRGIAAARRFKDDSSELRGFQLLAQIFQQVKDYQRAYRAQTLYATKQADYMKMQRHRQATDLEIRYSLKEKQRKIETLTKENQYQALLLEQNDQIKQQNTQLRQANEELQQFAYITSHDLKEPLRMIGSFSQIVQQQYAAQLDEKSGVYFKYINEGVTRMSSLLDALLQYATIGKAHVIEREHLDMNNIVQSAITNLTMKIEETGAQVHYDPMPVVKSVPSLLIQLLQNLIGNALKFKQEGQLPTVHISVKEENQEFCFRVKDNGIGINPEHKERIFVIFQRLHTRQKYEGTGIGLAICHKIVTQLGGRIWVESELGQGATFCFTLPKKPLAELNAEA